MEHNIGELLDKMEKIRQLLLKKIVMIELNDEINDEIINIFLRMNNFMSILIYSTCILNRIIYNFSKLI